MGKLTPVLGAFGSLPFVCSYGKVLTFHDLSRENAVRFAKHDVLGQKPILEFIGPELSTVSLSIRFDTSLGVPPLVGLKHIKAMMDNGMHKSLVIGGEYIGRFVIESISEERRFHTGAGVCQVAEATIKLTEYPAAKRVTQLSAKMSKFLGVSS